MSWLIITFFAALVLVVGSLVGVSLVRGDDWRDREAGRSVGFRLIECGMDLYDIRYSHPADAFQEGVNEACDEWEREQEEKRRKALGKSIHS